MFCAKEDIKLVFFGTRSSRCRFRRGDAVESLDVEAAPRFLVVLYPGDTLISVAKYFPYSFETEQKYPTQAIAKELK